MKEFTLRAEKCQSISDLHEELFRGIPLPGWYGRNLDGLYDCLTTMGSDLTLSVEDTAALRANLGPYADRFLRVLEDVNRENPHFFLVVDGASAHKVTEVVAALIWDGDRFLACQRPAHKARGLLWEFVGGKVEAGESKVRALIRECREELDVTVSVGEVFFDVMHEYPDLTVHLTLFHCAIEEGTPTCLEHAALRWVTVDEMDGLEFCPADEEILKALRQRNRN